MLGRRFPRDSRHRGLAQIHFGCDLAYGLARRPELRHLLPISDDRRTPVNAALLPRALQAGSCSFAQADAPIPPERS
jgi:hypothetical protein